MTGFTQSVQQTALDTLFPTSGGTDYIAYSSNGSSETGNLARTAIGATGWSSATAATPSVKANANALTSATASGAVNVTHVAIYSASTSGTQRTDWEELVTPRSLLTGDQITWASGAFQITLD